MAEVMTVLHQVGSLDIQGDQIINSMSGTRGLFRKEHWQRNESIPISELVEIRVSEQLDGSVSLSLARDAKEGPTYTKPLATGGSAHGFIHCSPPEAIEKFLKEAYEVNPTISIEWTRVRDDLAGASSIRVKTYGSSAEFEKDAPGMVAAGWRPENQTALAGHVNVRRTTARVLLGGFLVAGASRSKDKIIVTWVKGTDSTGPPASGAIAPPPVDGGKLSTEDIPGKLRQLAELRDTGIITDRDFEAKKAELLRRI